MVIDIFIHMCRFSASIIAFSSLKGIKGVKGWDSELGITKIETIGSLSLMDALILKSLSALFVNILGGMRLLSLNHFHRGTPSPIRALDVLMSHHTKTSTLPPSMRVFSQSLLAHDFQRIYINNAK